MKKVCLHISANQFPPLQEAHFTRKTWVELAKAFDEYHIVARSFHEKFEYYSEGNIHLHLVPALGSKSRSFLVSGWYIFYLIPRYSVTHLLAQSSILGGFAGALASRLFRIPMMCEVHGEEYFRYFAGTSFKDKFWAAVSKFSFHTARKVRSLNRLMTQKLQEQGIPHTVEIPNRVDLTLFNAPKTDFSLSNTIRLVSVGRFVKEKNYLQLIRFLAQSGLNFHLTLVGGGPLKPEYQSLTDALQLEARVTLIDWIPQQDLLTLMTGSDIYIQYSVSEGMPRTILEAMALQMPIISTNVGSIQGIIEQEQNGILIEVGDEQQLIGAIRHLIKEENLRRQIAAKALQDVKDKYEWNNIFSLYRSELSNM